MRAAAACPLPTAAARHGAGKCARVCLSRVLQVAFASSEWERRSREGGGSRVGAGVPTGTVESEWLSRPRVPCGLRGWSPARDQFSIGKRGRSLGLWVSF